MLRVTQLRQAERETHLGGWHSPSQLQLLPDLTSRCSWGWKTRIGRSPEFPRLEEFPGATHPLLAGPGHIKEPQGLSNARPRCL